MKDIDIKRVEEDSDTRYVDYLGARYSLSGACHLARYHWVRQFIKSKSVLDAGCGSGYGSSILAKYVKKYVGVDISENAILFANKKYKRRNIRFLNADLTKGVNLDEKFDVIISFDVLEHIKNADRYMKTLVNFLDDNGTLIIETPNALLQELYSVGHNPFHFKEYSPKELKDLVSPYFDEVEFVGHSIINKFKDERWKSKVKEAKMASNAQMVVGNQKNALRKSLKKIFPFWVKEIYKIIRLCFLSIFKRHELFYMDDIGFSNKDIDKLGGIFAICKHKNGLNK